MVKPMEEEPEALVPEEGEVKFMIMDGVGLNGNIFGSGNNWIILFHMYPTEQTSWNEFADFLSANGYIVLTYDFRGYGKSGGEKDVSVTDIDNVAAFSRYG